VQLSQCDQRDVAEGVRVQTNPWTSVMSPHYHNNTQCNLGREIQQDNRNFGTGGKPICPSCAKLNREGK
jgi:hypothetical protein